IVESGFVEPGLQLVERIVVRHVSREGYLAEGLAAIGSCNRELAILELDVGFRGFEQVCRDLLALGDDLVQRFHDRRAADCERARAVCAHAERNAPRVAMHDLDVLDRNAEPARNYLRESGLVSLPVAMRA